MKLLSAGHTNAKTSKTVAGYLNAILHLAPASTSGYNTCKWASPECMDLCLNTAGRGRFDNVQQARIRKTHMFFRQRKDFLALLIKDLVALEKKAKKLGLKPVVRLNGTSDLPWHKIKVDGVNTIFDMFSGIQFYDYTANVQALQDLKDAQANGRLQNYYLIFSHKETNLAECTRALELGFNVAIAFKDMSRALKDGAIDGDEHDFRFLEPYQSRIVALKAKGRAKKSCGGFVL